MPFASIEQTVVGHNNLVAGRDIVINRLPAAEIEDRANLRRLLGKVKEFWIKGVLEHSLTQQLLIDIEVTSLPQSVANPWERQIELPNRPALTEKLWDVFEQDGRTLLIVGEPGSGKTTTLLHLTQKLVDRAEMDPEFAEAIPIVLNLSTWIARRPLLDWMVSELGTKYQVPEKIARDWWARNRLVAMLDGLDEVRPDLRADCVAAINDFSSSQGLAGLVVAGRRRECEELPEKLQFGGAICLEPLSVSQIDVYLGKLGPQFAGLRNALWVDKELQELLQSPLILHIVLVTYEGKPLIPSDGIRESDEFKARVFRDYVRAMLARKGKRLEHYSPQQLMIWVRLLARGMQARSQSVFLIESLQADWLPSRMHQFMYYFVSRQAAGFYLGVPWLLPWLIALACVVSPEDKQSLWFAGEIFFLAGVIAMAVSSLGDFLRFARAAAASRPEGLVAKAITDRGAPGFLFHVLITGLLLWVSTILMLVSRIKQIDPARPDLMLYLLAVAGVVFLCAMEAAALWRTVIALTLKPRSAAADSADIHPANTAFSWAGLHRGALRGLRIGGIVSGVIVAAGLLLNVGFLTASWLRGDSTYRGTQPARLFAGFLLLSISNVVGFGGIGALIGALFGMIQRREVEITNRPNEGIRRSLTGAFATTGLIFGGLVVLLVGIWGMQLTQSFLWQAYESSGAGDHPMVDQSSEWNLAGAGLLAMFSFFLLWVAVCAGARYGGFDVIKHFILRFFLWQRSVGPLNYRRFLDDLVRLVLIQKVGGGYIFIHRLLLDYFAQCRDLEF
jgi:hypothetical protein